MAKKERWRKGYERWLAKCPKAVRELAARFPPGSTIRTPDGRTYHLMGFGELANGAVDLVASEIDPLVCYELAKKSAVHFCAHHIVRSE